MSAWLLRSAKHESPLRLLAAQTWTRTNPTRKMKARAGRTEMDVWFSGAQQIQERAQNQASSIVHVMDRQGDSYDLFAQMQNAGMRWVIRACHDRLLSSGAHLFQAVQQAPIQVTRDVYLSRRAPGITPSERRIYPARQGRTATLTVRAASLTIARSERTRDRTLPTEIRVNIVHVVEENAPEGQPPVSWYLVTSEPIDTPEQIVRILDIYRARWLIEEFFKALKTGCRYEKLQLESYDALLRALAIYLPIAWKILRLRYLAGREPNAPASMVVTPTQIEILRAISPDRLPKKPTARDVLLAIAARGGHIKNNGEPGWLVIARGFRDLLLIEVGWNARDQKCNASHKNEINH